MASGLFDGHVKVSLIIHMYPFFMYAYMHMYKVNVTVDMHNYASLDMHNYVSLDIKIKTQWMKTQ